MIVTQKKPTEEILAMIGDAKNVAIVGCGSCATTCQTGGMQQAEELRAILEDTGKTVVGIGVIDYCCMSLTVRTGLKPILAAQPECIICMGCGTGVQCVGKSVGMIPTYPSNNTMYVGEAVRYGMWHEACRLCGDCMLGQTGALCPITHCAKSLSTGPCGGQKNGKCEVHPENDCVWIHIYERLAAIGQLDKLDQIWKDKGHAHTAYPRSTNLRGKQE